MTTYGVNNLDETLEAADYKIKQDKQINPRWKEIAIRKINADTAYTDAQKFDALENVLSSVPREYSDASEPQIQAFLTKHLSSISQGLAAVLGSLFGLQIQNTFQDVNPDLKMAVMKGFKTYTSKKGKVIVAISLRKMLRPTDRASSYDKLVLLKAKRIVKLLRQSIAAANMTADVSLSKSYQKIRGGYNKNKYYYNPSARTSLTKQIAKKYGTINAQEYKTLANSALDIGLDGAKAKIKAIIDQGDSIANINRTSSVADRKGFRDAYGEAFLSKGRKIRNIGGLRNIEDVVALLNPQQAGRAVQFGVVPRVVQQSFEQLVRQNQNILSGLDANQQQYARQLLGKISRQQDLTEQEQADASTVGLQY